MTKQEYMREYNRDRYLELKAAGLCVKCKRESRPGKSRCADCQEIKTAKKAPGQAESLRRWRDARVAAGKCAVCGDRKPCPGRRSCETCLVRNRERNSKCWLCGEQGHADGKCAKRAANDCLSSADYLPSGINKILGQ